MNQRQVRKNEQKNYGKENRWKRKKIINTSSEEYKHTRYKFHLPNTQKHSRC